MIFDTKEWKHVAAHWPLLNSEIAELQQQVQDSSMIAYGMVMWGIELQEWAWMQELQGEIS